MDWHDVLYWREQFAHSPSPPPFSKRKQENPNGFSKKLDIFVLQEPCSPNIEGQGLVADGLFPTLPPPFFFCYSSKILLLRLSRLSNVIFFAYVWACLFFFPLGFEKNQNFREKKTVLLQLQGSTNFLPPSLQYGSVVCTCRSHTLGYLLLVIFLKTFSASLLSSRRSDRLPTRRKRRC